MTTRIVAALSSTALIALSLANCTKDPTDTNDMNLDEQYEQLAQRPDRDEAKNNYESLQEDVRSALRDRFELPEWEKGGSEESASPACTEFPEIGGWDAGKVTLQNWVTEESITIDSWPDAKAAVQDITGEHGFDQVTLDVEQSDNLTYELMDNWGAKLTLMSGRSSNTVVSIRTGCHLRPEAKERGRPISKEERREMPEESR
ncbi:Lipoprotein [Haloechinothrix alba]|uniref:Lipoprotein n=1 Tax=Haloechinothrix alba TaxID=664784 RepID=A0A238W472_9PSEU|nr:LppA family lipoprotein [Haloechinothrix alba]SNR41201.1 Lipoprotein [Haloechinothrix alba]